MVNIKKKTSQYQYVNLWLWGIVLMYNSSTKYKYNKYENVFDLQWVRYMGGNVINCKLPTITILLSVTDCLRNTTNKYSNFFV